MKRICSVDGCELQHHSYGMCNRHRARWVKYGAVEDPDPQPSIEERFWSKVDKEGDCWLWLGAKSHNGYGRFTPYHGKTVKAHRWSYESEIGPIPDGLTIDHRCHTRSCVNPVHLRLATTKQQGENKSGASANSRSGVLGVVWCERTRRWKAAVIHHGKSYFAGSHKTLKEAEAAVVKKRIELFTHNEIDRLPRKVQP